MKNIKIILIILVLITLLIVFKNKIFGCSTCADNNKTFIVEVKNIFQSAKEKNKLDNKLIYCKDSDNDDPLELQGRNDIYYYLELNDDNEVIKLIVYDIKNKLILKKINSNGIKIEDISEKDYNNDYEVSEIKCNSFKKNDN